LSFLSSLQLISLELHFQPFIAVSNIFAVENEAVQCNSTINQLSENCLSDKQTHTKTYLRKHVVIYQTCGILEQ